MISKDNLVKWLEDVTDGDYVIHEWPNEMDDCDEADYQLEVTGYDNSGYAFIPLGDEGLRVYRITRYGELTSSEDVRGLVIQPMVALTIAKMRVWDAEIAEGDAEIAEGDAEGQRVGDEAEAAFERIMGER